MMTHEEKKVFIEAAGLGEFMRLVEVHYKDLLDKWIDDVFL